MLVAVHVSSMNTRRSGSRSTWPSNHSWRCFRMSGRSCSIAWPVFFCASSRGARRSDAVQPQRPSNQYRPSLRAVPQAICLCVLSKWPEYRPHALQSAGSACHHPAALGRSYPSYVVAPASGSLSKAQRQIELPQLGNSYRRPPQPGAENVNPSKEVEPFILASFASTDSESEINASGNPSSIQIGRKPLYYFVILDRWSG